MAKFKFIGRDINIHWNGYDIKGPAGTEFTIPDQLYEEFEADIRGAEPTLTWIDTNEFLTLTNAVSVTTLTGTIPISVTSTTSGKTIAISSTTNPAGYYLRADGTGATTWSALPADATGITNIIGTSPISAAVVGTTATISLNASYQTAGNYVTGVVGTSPISTTGTTAITVSLNANYQTAGNYASSVSATLPISASLSTAGAVSISISTTGFQSAGSYQASGTYVNAVIGTSPASVLTASGTSTVSIVAGSINSTHLSATSVGSSQLIALSVGSAAIAAAAVNTSKLSSGAATSGQLLQADGLGAAVFATVPIAQTYVSTFTSSGTWTKPSGVTAVYMLAIGGGGSGGTGGRSVNATPVSGGGSGGGAAHMSRIMLASQLSATESVTVGAGGIATAAAARTTALANPVDGNAGGASFIGASWSSSARLAYVGAHGGFGALNPSSQYLTTPRLAPLYFGYSDTFTGTSSIFAPLDNNGATNTSNPFYAAAGGRGGSADSATSDNGVSGAFGMGYVTSGTVPAAGVGSATAATDGASATTIGGSGAGGGARRTGTAASFAGNGGNGYIGGGGGGGGSMHSASASCTAGTGGTGGAGLVIIVAW